MRVRIDLFYRDASNYKLGGSHSFLPPLLPDDVLRLQKTFVAEMGFVPPAVGLSCLSFSTGRSDDDHPWHNINTICLEDGEPDDIRTFSEFVDECEKADWHEAAAKWEYETPVYNTDDDEDDAYDEDNGDPS